MYQMIDTIKKLWSGAAVSFVDGNGALKETQIFPKPVQKEIPLWITSANNIETFISAGRLGLNVLTHLLGETIEGLAAKISAYRKAYIEGGYAIEKAQVALMLHTYIGEDTDEIHDKVHDPFINYLRTSVGLLKNLAVSLNIDINAESFSKEDMDVLLEHSFKRYVSSASLIGTKSTCVKMLDRLGEIGVTEIACLIDFGVEYNAVMKSLEYLTEIKTTYRSRATDTDLPDYSVHAQLKRHGVTHLQLTPSMAMLLKPALHSATSLRKLIIGGERLPLSLARDLYSGLSDVEIYNMYGPTETTIWSSCYKVGRKDGKILIGRPIANTKIYILDRAEKPVPVGMEGEIYIGGEGVARSYLNNPKLTKERFILNPFSAGERLYRTGDYGKWLVDGNIEYIGRKDDQVKIQGHRIELGEIEAALLHNQTIESCAVTSRDGAYGEKELVAYIVSRQALKIADIRSALDAKLPRYMLPLHYIQLDELPLNHSGKTDKKRLPELQGRGMETGVEYIAPRNDTEERLALIWQEILGKEKIGVKDNFFELGGNSIKITRLASLLNRRFEVKLGFQELFTNTVLEDQARSIRQSGKTSFTTISPAPVQPHYPLTSSQHRLWVLSQFEETSIA
ncbi:MAG: MupA/Atu3671 family FMN-dependent luciferase-like monooxygenase, partial [Bacteroidota bacterium]